MLFVYGTLRKAFDHPMHRLLRAHANFVGTGTFQGKLYDLGRFPGAVSSNEPPDKVLGEIYRLRDAEETFRILDEYEGTAFSRNRVSMRNNDGKKIGVWIYLYNRRVSKARMIPSGDYTEAGVRLLV